MAVGLLFGCAMATGSHLKRDCTGGFGAQRLDLATVLDFIQANIASHGQ